MDFPRGECRESEQSCDRHLRSKVLLESLRGVGRRETEGDEQEEVDGSPYGENLDSGEAAKDFSLSLVSHLLHVFFPFGKGKWPINSNVAKAGRDHRQPKRDRRPCSATGILVPVEGVQEKANGSDGCHRPRKPAHLPSLLVRPSLFRFHAVDSN